jgi:hypothetical protein
VAANDHAAGSTAAGVAFQAVIAQPEAEGQVYFCRYDFDRFKIV